MMTTKTPFCDRTDELERLAELIREGANILVVGIAGVGKTRLLEELVAKKSRYQLGNFEFSQMIDCSNIDQADALWDEMAKAIGMDAGTGYEKLKRFLADRENGEKPLVVVLDDLEPESLDEYDKNRLLKLNEYHVSFVAAVRPGALTRLPGPASDRLHEIFPKEYILWLKPLDPKATEELVAKLGGEKREEIIRGSGGHPYLAQALSEGNEEETSLILEEIWSDLDENTRSGLETLLRGIELPKEYQTWLQQIGLSRDGKAFGSKFEEFVRRKLEVSAGGYRVRSWLNSLVEYYSQHRLYYLRFFLVSLLALSLLSAVFTVIIPTQALPAKCQILVGEIIVALMPAIALLLTRRYQQARWPLPITIIIAVVVAGMYSKYSLSSVLVIIPGAALVAGVMPLGGAAHKRWLILSITFLIVVGLLMWWMPESLLGIWLLTCVALFAAMMTVWLWLGV